MSKKITRIETPNGRHGKNSVVIPTESILEILDETQSPTVFEEDFQTIRSYGKDDVFKLRLTPVCDKRHRHLIVAKVFVESAGRFAYFALHKRQEHYDLDPRKTYVCRRNHVLPLAPIGNIDLHTIEIISEEKPGIPARMETEAEAEAAEGASIKIQRDDRMAILTFSSIEEAALAQDILGRGWYDSGRELRKIYGRKPSPEDIMEENLLIRSLPEKIRLSIKEKKMAKRPIVLVAKKKREGKRRK